MWKELPMQLEGTQYKLLHIIYISIYHSKNIYTYTEICINRFVHSALAGSSTDMIFLAASVKDDTDAKTTQLQETLESPRKLDMYL